MHTTWLLEKGVFKEDLGPLIDEIKRQGHECQTVSYIPFKSGTYNLFDDKDCVICYGSLNLMRQLSREKKWVPGPFLNLPNYECTTYYSYFGKYLLNSDYIMLPFVELNRRKVEVFNYFGGNCFIRPSTGFKSFTGEVFSLEGWDKDIEWIKDRVSPESMIIISSAKNIDAEYRFVVANKKIISGSKYKTNGELDIVSIAESHLFVGMTEALIKAREISEEKWEPDKTYVIDIGEYNGEMYLIEINSFSCSGLYACELEPIVKTISELAINEWKEVWE
jgi:hypothetical protein